ncbi:hypothetical protein KSU1_D0786 [Candidatus Jettenia caeni]|uniref:Uncharacterized protein n=1 Tax=Candidatus Jettenia caeni TaxID=247490 RepID=I3IQV0_9BACT|nr:hypothetical protein KSU1_D0786 [Candidatus Jettenia caeni]
MPKAYFIQKAIYAHAESVINKLFSILTPLWLYCRKSYCSNYIDTGVDMQLIS